MRLGFVEAAVCVLSGAQAVFDAQASVWECLVVGRIRPAATRRPPRLFAHAQLSALRVRCHDFKMHGEFDRSEQIVRFRY